MRCATPSTHACAIADRLKSARSQPLERSLVTDMVRNTLSRLFPLYVAVGLFAAACGPAAGPAPSSATSAPPAAAPTTSPAGAAPTVAAAAKPTTAPAAAPT